MIKWLYKFFRNKIFLYLSTRYVVYGLQFVSLMLVATKMDPYEYGRWGFILMLISYFATINFGIANSVNVLMVQNKSDINKQKDIVASSIFSICLLVFGVFLIALIYSQFDYTLFTKYEIGLLFYVVCVIAAFEYINRLFSNIYRVNNRILELSIYQSSIPILIFVSVVLFSGYILFYALILSYLVSHLLSFSIFIFRKGIPFGGRVSKSGVLSILNKGLYLFLYNACFYLVLISVSFVISNYYSVEEYGLYTFSYNLGHAVLMILEAFAFLVFPKLLDRLYSDDLEIVNKTLCAIRDNYVCLSHGMMYLAMMFFPIFVSLFPKYRESLPALFITSSAVLLSTNSFGYNTLLIAKNKEKIASSISLFSLFCTISIAIIMAMNEVPYWAVPFAMMISYLLFALLCSYASSSLLQKKKSFMSSIESIMPIKLIVPFTFALIIPIYGSYFLSFLPFCFFVLLNTKTICNVWKTIGIVYNNSSFIDI